MEPGRKKHKTRTNNDDIFALLDAINIDRQDVSNNILDNCDREFVANLQPWTKYLVQSGEIQ